MYFPCIFAYTGYYMSMNNKQTTNQGRKETMEEPRYCDYCGEVPIDPEEPYVNESDFPEQSFCSQDCQEQFENENL